MNHEPIVSVRKGFPHQYMKSRVDEGVILKQKELTKKSNFVIPTERSEWRNL